jgi:hypothetical protein
MIKQDSLRGEMLCIIKDKNFRLNITILEKHFKLTRREILSHLNQIKYRTGINFAIQGSILTSCRYEIDEILK